MTRNLDLPEGYRLNKSGGCVFVARAGYEKTLRDVSDGRADLRSAPDLEGRAAAFRLAPRGSEPPLLVKQYWRGGLFRGVMRQRFLRTGRFLSELLLTETARAAGLRTARAAGLLMKRVDLIFWTATLVTEEIEGARDLARLARESYAEMPRARRNSLLNAVASEIRKMHDAGIFHADLHLKNILARERNSSPEVFIIDFDRGGYFRELPLRRRLENLMRLDRSVEKFNRSAARISASDRLRLLKYYAGRDAEMYRRLKRGVRAFAVRREIHRLWWRLISIFKKG